MTINPRAVRVLRDARTRLREAAAAEHSIAASDRDAAAERLSNEHDSLEATLDDAGAQLADARTVHDLDQVAAIVVSHRDAITVASKTHADASTVADQTAGRLRERARQLKTAERLVDMSDRMRADREARPISADRRHRWEAAMIRVQTTPSAPARRSSERDDRDDASSVDFKSHLQGATSKPRAEQPKPAPKKQPAQQDDSASDAPPAAPQVQAQTEPQPLTDLGAAITRALAALQAPTGTPAAMTATAAIESPQAPVAPDATAPMTPLEQAVHDIIAALPQPKPEIEHDENTDDDDTSDKAPQTPVATPVVVTTEPAKNAPVARTVVDQPAPIAEPRATEMPAATSHMHLVVGDGDDRVVVTVAVRGEDVNVSLRSNGDDNTAAALARNAASLDHAMRARGLDLASFSSERDPDHPPAATGPTASRSVTTLPNPSCSRTNHDDLANPGLCANTPTTATPSNQLTGTSTNSSSCSWRSCRTRTRSIRRTAPTWSRSSRSSRRSSRRRRRTRPREPVGRADVERQRGHGIARRPQLQRDDRLRSRSTAPAHRRRST